MEHQRIDEGVKRPQHEQPPARRTLEGDSWTIPAGLDAEEVLLQYLTEGATSGIAKRYGLRRGALTRWLQHVKPKEWKEIQVIRALCTKEDGEEGIYDSKTALQLARARELLRSAQWDLERLDPANYGPKQEVTHVVSPILTISIVPVVAQLPHSEHVLVQQSEQDARIIPDQPEQLVDKG